MRNLIARILVLAAIELLLSFAVFGQTQCERNYRTCVGRCNAARDQTQTRNDIRRSQITLQLGRDLIQCNVQNVGNPAARDACRNEKQAAADAALAQIDASDLQAERDRISCITECRRQLRECQQPPPPQPSAGGNFIIECLDGGAPCRGPVSEFCTKAAGSCDDCWRSLCGGGEWIIDSEVPLRSVTLVAVSTASRSERVLATSSIRGLRAIFNVPRNIRLGQGEQLYFQFRSITRPRRPVTMTLRRTGR
jgi:hypothetical protein